MKSRSSLPTKVPELFIRTFLDYKIYLCKKVLNVKWKYVDPKFHSPLSFGYFRNLQNT